MAPLANPSESVSLFAMFSFFLLKNISMFPDLEMINKMHKNGEKQYVWKKHCSHGKCVFPGVCGGGLGVQILPCHRYGVALVGRLPLSVPDFPSLK